MPKGEFFKMTQVATIFVGLLFIGALTLNNETIKAAPEGAPWYRTEPDVARTFNTREREVFQFVTGQLITGLDSADREVVTFAETFARGFLDEFGLNPDGAEPSEQKSFVRERAEIERLMLLVSPPGDGGNGDTAYTAFSATIVVIDPAP